MDEAPETPGPVSRGRALLLLAGGLTGVAAACALALRGVEPFPTWLYPFAWYPLLVALEGGVALRRGRFFVLDRPRAVASLLLWSVPVWMLFEVLNLRIRNWYYVLVPGERGFAWLGITISFATVLPAVYLPAVMTGLAERGRADDGEDVRDGHGGAQGGGASSMRGGTPRPDAARLDAPTPLLLHLAGLVSLALPLAWPRIFFPLIWGVFFFLAEGTLCRRAPAASLVVDLREGRKGRVLALLVGGALAGLFWESLNWMARARWIYTVPGLEELKWFEMPPLGFLGFPALALSAHAVYGWLVLHGVAARVDLQGTPRSSTGGPDGVGRIARALAPLLVVGALLGMERWTISSRSVHLRDLPGLLPHQVEDLRVWGVDSPFELAEHEPASLAEAVPGVSSAEARSWIDAAHLATLRGLGARNARLLWSWGVESPAELARAGTGALVRCFRDVAPPPVRGAQVRVWQRAARRELRSGEMAPESGGLPPACGGTGREEGRGPGTGVAPGGP